MAKEISLALGSGGARGIAHIGVIRVLEREGFKIRSVAGTSIGGIIAALYADGHSPDEIIRKMKAVDQTKLYGRRFNESPSMLGLAGVADWLEKIFGNKKFSDLKLPCAVTATELRAPAETILNEGRLVDALLATIAVPGIFPPKEDGNRLYVDGALMNPVPVSVARSFTPNLPIVAVTLSPLITSAGRMYKIPIPDSIPRPLLDQIKRLSIAQAFDVFLDSIEVTTRMITELRLERDRPDLIIRPPLEDIGILDVIDIEAIAMRGEAAAISALPELRRITHWSESLRRRVFR